VIGNFFVDHPFGNADQHLLFPAGQGVVFLLKWRMASWAM
jgi:hypothetical protein